MPPVTFRKKACSTSFSSASRSSPPPSSSSRPSPARPHLSSSFFTPSTLASAKAPSRRPWLQPLLRRHGPPRLLRPRPPHLPLAQPRDHPGTTAGGSLMFVRSDPLSPLGEVRVRGTPVAPAPNLPRPAVGSPLPLGEG